MMLKNIICLFFVQVCVGAIPFRVMVKLSTYLVYYCLVLSNLKIIFQAIAFSNHDGKAAEPSQMSIQGKHITDVEAGSYSPSRPFSRTRLSDVLKWMNKCRKYANQRNCAGFFNVLGAW